MLLKCLLWRKMRTHRMALEVKRVLLPGGHAEGLLPWEHIEGTSPMGTGKGYFSHGNRQRVLSLMETCSC